jgi:ABC-type transport system involved in Fe-S cluster assembly fused permease/ATPase subunit
VLAKPRLSFWLDGGFLCRRGRICADLKTNVKKMDSNFEWDNDKNVENKNKHHVSFDEAQYAFFDSNRVSNSSL